jgi:hypothetical protein
MSALGTFLEVSIRTKDIIESLGFYKRLGFTEQSIGDIWSHKYAVVSDGNVSIGLHERVFDSPAITFVHEDIARCVRSMSDHGFDFSYQQLDEDAFNLLAFSDSDGHTVGMLEARTFMSPDEDTPDSVCGSCFEVTLPVRDTVHAGLFWAPLAPTLLNLREEPTTHMRFDAGGMPLGLSESIALKQPSLCFRCDDKEALAHAIELHGLNSKAFPGFEGAFVELQAPEGTTLYAFSEDFLGESYEVDESGDVPVGGDFAA